MGSIHYELKRLRQLRVLGLFYEGGEIPEEKRNEALNKLEHNINNTPALKYYVDFVLGIELTLKGYPISELRRADYKLERFEDERFDVARPESVGDRPCVLVFTSSPNKEADIKIREALSENIELSDSTYIGVKVQSRTAFGELFFKISAFEEERFGDNKLCLLLFQTKAGVPPSFTNSANLFSNVQIGPLCPICCGLLEGDIDGFVIYANKLDEVCNSVIKKSADNYDERYFLSSIIPSRLYLISAEKIIYNIKKNYKDIWQKIGYENIQEWQSKWPTPKT